jgi:MtrB/PioB family decaheme-associated outer membrane protein
MRGGKQGRYEIRAGWQGIPKYRGYGTQTPFLGVGGDNLTLPADWVYASTTDEMTALQDSLVPAELKLERKIFDAGVTMMAGGNWTFNVDYQRQDKEGTRSMGGGLFNSSLLPAPVNFTTNIFDVSMGWAGRRGQVEVAYMASSFENKYASLTWRNPFSSRSVNYYLQSALEPDNNFYQLSISGAFAFTPRIRLSGQASTGRATQNDAFLAYTLNPDYADLALPRTSLKGKLDTSSFNLTGKLFAKLNNRLSFTARGKFDERDNNTPIEIYTPIKLDILPGNARFNRPYSYEREQYSADLRFRAHQSIRLSAGAGQKNMDRTFQAIERSEETTYWGDIKINPSYSSQFRLKMESSSRDISDYLQPFENPLMRKFNQADRDRERIVAEFDFMPTESLGINVSYFKAESEYTESQIGLQDSIEDSYTVNLNYAVGKKFNLYAFVTREDINSELLNATSVSAPPWRAQTSDEIDTNGFGLSAHVSDKTSLGLDIVNSESKGEILVQTDDEDPFSPLRTKLTNARLHFDHEINERWGYKLYAEYETYKSKDWALDGMGVDAIGSVLTFGELPLNYSIWYFRVQASYRF